MKNKLLHTKLWFYFALFGIGTNVVSAQIIETKPISCPGANDGQLSVEMLYGATCEWTLPNGTTSDEFVLKGLSAGTYSVRVTDGMTDPSYVYELQNPAALANTFAINNNSFWTVSGGNGTIEIITTGGSGWVTYTLTDSISREVVQQKANLFLDLPSGTFFLKTTDVAGCYRFDTVRVADAIAYQQLNDQPIKPDTTACWKGEASTSVKPDTANVQFPVEVYFDGELYKTILGYTRPDDFENYYTDTFTPVPAFSDTRNNSFPLYVMEISAITKGDHIGLDTISGTSSSFSESFRPGFHILQVISANGRGFRYSWDVDSITAPVSIHFTQKNNPCFGDQLGSITAKAQGSYETYDDPFKYQISGPRSSSSASIGSLPAGVYTITATDKEGCSGTQSVTITQPDEPLRIEFAVLSQSKCPYSLDGEVEVVRVHGATEPISYEWNSGSTEATASGLQSGAYEVSVTDANNCKASDSIELPYEQSACFYNIVTPNGDGYNDYFDLSDICTGLQMKAVIFNEHGKLIATLNELNPRWDAKDASTPPTGTASTYTCFVQLFQDGKKISEFGESFSVIYQK